MAVDWKKLGQITTDLAIDGGKNYVKEIDKKFQNIEKEAERKARKQGLALSNETYSRFDDAYSKIDNAYETLNNLEERFHSKSKNGLNSIYEEDDYYYDDEDDYNSYWNYIENQRRTSSNISPQNLLKEELEEKAENQIKLSSKMYEISNDDIAQMENSWYSLGLLKDIDLTSISQDVAGLIRLKINEHVVYIIRVIEIKSGGFQKKLHDLKTLTNISNRKLQNMLCENIDVIRVEILNVGKNIEDVDYARSLEKTMLKQYKPTWN